MRLETLGPDHVLVVVGEAPDRAPIGPIGRQVVLWAAVGLALAAAVSVGGSAAGPVALMVFVTVSLGGLLLASGEARPRTAVRIEVRGGRILLDGVDVDRLDVQTTWLAAPGRVIELDPALTEEQVARLREIVAASRALRDERRGSPAAVPGALAALRRQGGSSADS